MRASQIFEARDPNLKYTEIKKRKIIQRVIVELRGTESAAFTRLGRTYKRVLIAEKKLKEMRKNLNTEIRPLVEVFFNAADRVMTRVVKTVSLTYTLSKMETQKEPEKVIDWEGIANELAELLPEAAERLEELKEKYTSVIEADEQKLPGLRIKLNKIEKITSVKNKRGGIEISEAQAAEAQSGFDELVSELENFTKEAAKTVFDWSKKFTTALGSIVIKINQHTAKSQADELITQDMLDRPHAYWPSQEYWAQSLSSEEQKKRLALNARAEDMESADRARMSMGARARGKLTREKGRAARKRLGPDRPGDRDLKRLRPAVDPITRWRRGGR